VSLPGGDGKAILPFYKIPPFYKVCRVYLCKTRRAIGLEKLKHFDPSSNKNNTRAPAKYDEAAPTRKEKEGCLAQMITKYHGQVLQEAYYNLKGQRSVSLRYFVWSVLIRNLFS
jgi:hypothetical protein